MNVYVQGNSPNQWWPALTCQAEAANKSLKFKMNIEFTTVFGNEDTTFPSVCKYVSDDDMYIENLETGAKRKVIFHSGEGSFPILIPSSI